MIHTTTDGKKYLILPFIQGCDCGLTAGCEKCRLHSELIDGKIFLEKDYIKYQEKRKEYWPFLED